MKHGVAHTVSCPQMKIALLAVLALAQQLLHDTSLSSTYCKVKRGATEPDHTTTIHRAEEAAGHLDDMV